MPQSLFGKAMMCDNEVNIQGNTNKIPQKIKDIKDPGKI